MSKIAVLARRPAVSPPTRRLARSRGHRLLRAAAIGAITCGPAFWSADAFGATNSWNTDSSGLWTGSTNWSLSHVPGVGEDALISRASANPTITLSSGSHSINSLTSDEAFIFSGGTLNLAAASQLNGAATFSSGTLGGAGTMTLAGAGTWSGGTFTGGGFTKVGLAGILNVISTIDADLDGRTMENHGVINYSGTQSHWVLNNGTINNLSGATFNVSVNTPTTLLIDLGLDFNGINAFQNAGTLNKTGTGSFSTVSGLPVDNSGTVNVLGGTLNFGGPVNQVSGNVLSGGTWNVSNNSTISFAGAVTPLITQIDSGASVKLDGAISAFSNIDQLEGNGGAFTITNGRVFATIGAFTNGFSGITTIGSGSVLRVNDSLVNLGKIDVNHALTIDYTGTSPLSDIRSQIISGYAGGSWTGGAITSSSAAAVAANSGNSHKTGLGYANAASIGIVGSGTFAGQSVDDTSVLVLYTFYGDANLDGAVNSADFSRLAANFGQSGKFWSDGDYNYDGIVNSLDFNALASNFGQGPAPSAPDGGLSLGQTVPEPAALGLISLAMIGLSRRRRILSRA